MGLKLSLAFAAILVGLPGCIAKPIVTKNKYYLDCCNPALTAHEKSMCKWAKENPGRIIIEGDYKYEMVWSNCEPGKEPWLKWED